MYFTVKWLPLESPHVATAKVLGSIRNFFREQEMAHSHPAFVDVVPEIDAGTRRYTSSVTTIFAEQHMIYKRAYKTGKIFVSEYSKGFPFKSSGCFVYCAKCKTIDHHEEADCNEAFFID